MKPGKLPNDVLNDWVLKDLPNSANSTVLAARVGEDCCAVRLGKELCVMSTDPITAGGKNTGALAIHVNANDIAASGAKPIAALTTILLPPDSDEAELRAAVAQMSKTAYELEIDIVGGHTEITPAVNRLVISVAMIGKPVVPGKIIKTADMCAGDDIVMTKFAGLEGTVILANRVSAKMNSMSPEEREELAYAERSLSVVKEGLICARTDGVHAMHDITEGGVIGAVVEMCEASGKGAEIDLSVVPVLPFTEKLCARLDLDAYGLISSGSLLISATDGSKVAACLQKEGIPSIVIGTVIEEGLFDISRGRKTKLRPYDADQLYKAFDRPPC